MNHSGNQVFVFRFNGKTVAPVTHGDDGILEVGAVGIQQGIQLCVQPIRSILHRSPYLVESGAGVITDFFFRDNTALDFIIYRGKRFKTAEKFFQGILRQFAFLVPSVVLCPCRNRKDGADSQNFLKP